MESKNHTQKIGLSSRELRQTFIDRRDALSNGELYTILTNKAAKVKKGTIVAMIAGTKAQTVIAIIEKIPLKLRNTVSEITLDMAANMGF
jgi:hypothetical protein